MLLSVYLENVLLPRVVMDGMHLGALNYATAYPFGNCPAPVRWRSVDTSHEVKVLPGIRTTCKEPCNKKARIAAGHFTWCEKTFIT
jgi:hypothetical protein